MHRVQLSMNAKKSSISKVHVHSRFGSLTLSLPQYLLRLISYWHSVE